MTERMRYGLKLKNQDGLIIWKYGRNNHNVAVIINFYSKVSVRT